MYIYIQLYIYIYDADVLPEQAIPRGIPYKQPEGNFYGSRRVGEATPIRERPKRVTCRKCQVVWFLFSFELEQEIIIIYIYIYVHVDVYVYVYVEVYIDSWQNLHSLYGVGRIVQRMQRCVARNWVVFTASFDVVVLYADLVDPETLWTRTSTITSIFLRQFRECPKEELCLFCISSQYYSKLVSEFCCICYSW